MGRAKKGLRGHGILAQALGGLRNAKLALQVFRIELRGAFKAKSASSWRPASANKSAALEYCSMASSFLFCLLQKGVAGDALGRLRSAAAQEAVIYGQGFALVAGLNEHVEQQPIVDAGAIRLIGARIQVA